jgi:hypothetical protein
MLAGTRVRISWQTNYKYAMWNETCAYAIEKFGLPGDKYETHVTEDYMDFYFTDERDAILFELACG